MKKLALLLALALVAVGSPAVADTSVSLVSPPRISGSGKVGTVLTVEPAVWSPQPSSRSYEWLCQGEGKPLGTGASYTITPADRANADCAWIWVVETGRWPQVTDKEASNPIDVVSGTITTPSIAITGTSGVNQVLTGTLAGGNADSTTKNWTKDGVAIVNATGETYQPTKADAGHRIGLRAVSTKDDYPDATRDSAPRAIPAYWNKRPTVSGAARVGTTLKRTSKGTWYAAGYAFSYRWLRNGKPIPGATTSTYTLTSADRGRRIAARVTAKKSGYRSVVVDSARTSRVK